MTGTTSRRAVLALLFGTAILPACKGGSRRSARERLVEQLGLLGDEASWLSDLRPRQMAALASALSVGTLADPEFELLLELLGPRSRLFRYVGYPDRADTPSVCDGAIRE